MIPNFVFSTIFLICMGSFAAPFPLLLKSSSNHKVLLSSSIVSNENQASLYNILESSPGATREELKRKYIKLAKILHPDVKCRRNDDLLEEKSTHFSQVASAWKILSDSRERQRYDRSLLAKEIVSGVKTAAFEISASMIPFLGKMYQIAVKFLVKLKTDKKIVNGVETAASEISSSITPFLGKMYQMTIKFLGKLKTEASLTTV